MPAISSPWLRQVPILGPEQVLDLVEDLGHKFLRADDYTVVFPIFLAPTIIVIFLFLIFFGKMLAVDWLQLDFGLMVAYLVSKLL